MSEIVSCQTDDQRSIEGQNIFLLSLHLHTLIAKLLTKCMTELWSNSNQSVLHCNTSLYSLIFNLQFSFLNFFFTWSLRKLDSLDVVQTLVVVL